MADMSEAESVPDPDNELEFRQAKTSFKDALGEAKYQVKALELERNRWHAKYNDLAKGLEEMKLRMKADCQKQLQDRFDQFVSEWNRQDLAKGIEELGLKMKADCQRQLQDRFDQFVSEWNRQDLGKGLEEVKLKMRADCQKQLSDRFHQFVSEWNRQDLGRYAPRQEPPPPRVENHADNFFRDADSHPPSEVQSLHDNGDVAARRRMISNREDAVRYVADRVASNQASAPPQQRRNTNPS